MPDDLDDIIVETVQIGGALRVTALDTASLVEVVFQAPSGADRSAILQLARQKLAWRLAKDKEPAPSSGNRRGTLA